MSEIDTLTIFCCGTNFSRANLDEAVALTYQVTKGRKWINDGPGNRAHPIRKSEKVMKHIDDPLYKHSKDQSFGQRIRSKIGPHSFAPEALYNHWFNTNPTGSMAGWGTADNVINTIQWLWLQYWSTQIDPQKAGQAPKPAFNTINLVGWSRGAVSCTMIAHAIAEAGFAKLMPTLKVNIFAFDPVPGGANDFKVKGSFSQTGRVGSPDTLPHIVNHYAAILMENLDGNWVKRALFKCTAQPRMSTKEQPFVGRHRGTFITEYPLPGSHSDAVMFNQADNPSGKIGISLCHEFLIRHGTEIETSLVLTDKELLEAYSAARIKWSAPEDKSKKTEPTSYRKNLVLNMMRENSCFINMHNFDVFKRVLPSVWMAISGNTPLQEFQKKRLEITCPNTYEAMVVSNYI